MKFEYGNFKYVIIMLACALLFVGATCVYATDDVAYSNETDDFLDLSVCEQDTISVENEVLDYDLEDDHNNMPQQKQDHNDLSINIQGNEEKVNPNPCDVVSGGSADDLANDLKRVFPGNTYTLDKDYIFNQDSHSKNGYGILIYFDNITIDGNGHTIDGKNKSSIFEITGSDVKIINLNIINCNHATGESPIKWRGDNGVISNCVFARNTAEAGGAITWAGNNGRIDNCTFISNNAKIAGDIYITGTANTVYNSTFLNYTSEFSNESIYIGRNGKNNAISSTFDSIYSVLDGSECDIDRYHCDGSIMNVAIADKKMNMIPILYEALTNDKANGIEGIEFYGKFVNNTYVLTFTKKFDNDIRYEKNIYFKGIHELEDIFNVKNLIDYTSNQTLVKKVFIDNEIQNEIALSMNKTNVDSLLTAKGLKETMELDNEITIQLVFEYSENYKRISKSGSFKDLKNDLLYVLPGETYNLDKDIYYGDADFECGKIGINILRNNITINGNGHIIDANNRSRIFNIKGNNVKIYNLTIINSYIPDTLSSPITWSGNDGILSDCQFYNNAALIGGAIKWTGNNGIINNTLFTENTASLIGGGIYFAGENNTLINSIFKNTFAPLTGEAIYFDSNSKNCSVITCRLNNYIPILNGKNTQIDVLKYYNIGSMAFFGQSIDLFPIIYQSITIGGKLDLGDNITCGGMLFNKSSFVFSLNKDFGNNLIFERNYYIYNVTCWNDVFEKIRNVDYVYENILTKTVNIKNLNDYENARLSYCNNIYSDELSKALESIAYNRVPLVTVLTLNFTENTYESHETWFVNSTKFDIINFQGHGSKIFGSCESRTEYKWLKVAPNTLICINDLQVSSFNTALENLGGHCLLNQVKLSGNYMSYYLDRDWGAGILNTGIIQAVNCVFTNNHAQNGGAIFNQGYLDLYNCSFEGNSAQDKGADICNAQNGTVLIDGNNITTDNGPVTQAGGLSLDDITIISAAALVGTAIISFGVGFITANPIAGMAIGALIGASIGTAASYVIIHNTYDVNFNRMKLAVVLIGGCTLVGAATGYLGGYLGQQAALTPQTKMIAEHNANVDIVKDYYCNDNYAATPDVSMLEDVGFYNV